MKRMTILAGLCLVSSAAACGGTGTDPIRIFGVWQDCDGDEATFTFNDDGTFAFKDRNDDISGTFTADESRVDADGTDAAEGGKTVGYEFTYYVSQDDRLMVGAAFPVGEHDGIVGNWTAFARIDAEDRTPLGGESEIEFLADGTGTMIHHHVDGSPDDVREGTWREEAEEFVFTYLYDDSGTMITVNIHFELVDDAVLGSPFVLPPSLTYAAGMRRALAFLLLIGCGSSSNPSDVPDAEPPDPPDADGNGYHIPAGYSLTPFLTTEAQHNFPMAGAATLPGRDYLAVLETDVGILVFDLHEDDTPITVNSFVWLALHHYFDGIAFHRVIEGFVAQGDPNTIDGDPSTWGTGGPGYGYGLEIVPALTYDGPGVVGMARTSDPNSNGSQFFITLAATPTLNGQYTIFARVTEGENLLASIARGEPPAVPTRMTRVYVVERAD